MSSPHVDVIVTQWTPLHARIWEWGAFQKTPIAWWETQNPYVLFRNHLTDMCMTCCCATVYAPWCTKPKGCYFVFNFYGKVKVFFCCLFLSQRCNTATCTERQWTPKTARPLDPSLHRCWNAPVVYTPKAAKNLLSNCHCPPAATSKGNEESAKQLPLPHCCDLSGPHPPATG